MRTHDGPATINDVVQTQTMTHTVPVYRADDPTQAFVTRVLTRPKIVPFTPKPSTELDQILDEVKANAHDIEDIVILYRSKKGEYVTVSNQGDTAGNLLFIEKAKMRFLQDDKPPSGSSAG